MKLSLALSALRLLESLLKDERKNIKLWLAGSSLSSVVTCCSSRRCPGMRLSRGLEVVDACRASSSASHPPVGARLRMLKRDALAALTQVIFSTLRGSVHQGRPTTAGRGRERAASGAWGGDGVRLWRTIARRVCGLVILLAGAMATTAAVRQLRRRRRSCSPARSTRCFSCCSRSRTRRRPWRADSHHSGRPPRLHARVDRYRPGSAVAVQRIGAPPSGESPFVAVLCRAASPC